MIRVLTSCERARCAARIQPCRLRCLYLLVDIRVALVSKGVLLIAVFIKELKVVSEPSATSSFVAFVLAEGKRQHLERQNYMA